MSREEPRPIDLSKLRTYSIGERGHKVAVSGLAGLPGPGARFAEWWESLPGFLGAAELRAVRDVIVAARRGGRPVAFAMGAHVVKVGCSPIVVDLIRRGVVTAVAMHGATAIHDAELALFGETSEEVGETLRDGRFGMVAETAAFFAEALGDGPEARATRVGLGRAIGEALRARGGPHVEHSILAAAAEAGIAATVHVAIGTDTVHMHPSVDAGALGAASGVDFRIICGVVAEMGAGHGPEARATRVGGVWCNIGSAVILPEVFLKAVAVARNLGHDLDAMHAVNLDMMRHYRPGQNVIGRPVLAGHGHEVIGQHEVVLPLLRQGIVEVM
jgi:hypothetical protein